jgi:lipopolysaccharide/colanic/teichoic acid biosynthesis glycosyltransferase
VMQEPGRAEEKTLHAPIEEHPATRPLLPRSSPRWFDFLAAAGGLLFLAPLLAAIAAAIKLSDGGFVLFRQTRIGRNSRPFRVCKFRTMVPGAERFGAAITAGQDSRITHLGKLLRQSKLDELPQIWNVLRGEMALVGPRPEVPRYVEQFQSSYEWLLRVRPGMTDPASLAFFREEEQLTGPELESRYASAILPRKLALSSDYLSRRTWASDFVLILRTLARVVRPGSAALSAEDRPVLPAGTAPLPRRIR